LDYHVFKEMWSDIRLLFTEDFRGFIDNIISE